VQVKHLVDLSCFFLRVGLQKKKLFSAFLSAGDLARYFFVEGSSDGVFLEQGRLAMHLME
jgi:hypothetical protein